MNRLFILGWDGATWDLLDGWLEEGHLPNLKKLVEEGSKGILESTIPAVTPPAWTSFSTGVNPGKHGIFGFLELDEDYNFKLINSNNVQVKPFWKKKKGCIVINVPITYPPQEMKGFLVSGMLTPSSYSDFTHPKSLKEEIRENVPGYRITQQWESYEGQRNKFLEELYDMTENRHKLIKYMMTEKEWNVFFAVIIGTDRIQHLCWEEDELLKYYQRLDDYLGEYLEELQEEDTVLLVSDHGFGPVEKKVSVNGLLKKEGFLKTKAERGGSVLRKLGLTKDNAVRIMRFFGVDVERLSRKLPEKMKNIMPSEKESVLRDVDFSRTDAFMIGQGNIYLNTTRRFNKGTVTEGSYEEVRNQVIEKLEKLNEEEKIFGDIHTKEEAYGNSAGNSPDIIVEPAPGFSISKSINEKVFEKPGSMKADHRKEGIWASNKKLDIEKIKIHKILEKSI